MLVFIAGVTDLRVPFFYLYRPINNNKFGNRWLRHKFAHPSLNARNHYVTSHLEGESWVRRTWSLNGLLKTSLCIFPLQQLDVYY